MADETPSPIPPRQQPVTPAPAAAPSPVPSPAPTIRLRRPGEPAPSLPRIQPAVKITPLAPSAAPAAAPVAPAAPAPAAPAPAPAISIPTAAPVAPAPAAAAPAAPAPAEIAAAKSKTSRIPLEAALGAAAIPAAPKTIRLKKPGEAAAPAVGPIPVATPLGAAAASQTTRLPTAKLATARIPESVASDIPAAGEEAPLTRRKTIKVRRPGAAGGPQVTVNTAPRESSGEGAESAGDEAPWTAPQGSIPVFPAKDGAHWTFVVAACLGILVTLATCVVLAAQAWGPDASLTQFSSWPSGPDIALPGTYVP